MCWLVIVLEVERVGPVKLVHEVCAHGQVLAVICEGASNKRDDFAWCFFVRYMSAFWYPYKCGIRDLRLESLAMLLDWKPLVVIAPNTQGRALE